MIYTEYGNTGKIVSRLGFGANRFEAEYLQDEKGLQHCADVVRYAASSGINYFDTGHNYDQNKSEIILALPLKIFTGLFMFLPNQEPIMIKLRMTF